MTIRDVDKDSVYVRIPKTILTKGQKHDSIFRKGTWKNGKDTLKRSSVNAILREYLRGRWSFYVKSSTRKGGDTQDTGEGKPSEDGNPPKDSAPKNEPSSSTQKEDRKLHKELEKLERQQEKKIKQKQKEELEEQKKQDKKELAQSYPRKGEDKEAQQKTPMVTEPEKLMDLDILMRECGWEREIGQPSTLHKRRIMAILTHEAEEGNIKGRTPKGKWQWKTTHEDFNKIKAIIKQVMATFIPKQETPNSGGGIQQTTEIPTLGGESQMQKE